MIGSDSVSMHGSPGRLSCRTPLLQAEMSVDRRAHFYCGWILQDIPGQPPPARSVRPLEMAGSRFAIIQDPLLAVMRILVIEDETKVGCFIKRALEEESYAVDLCEDGAKGLRWR